MATKREVPHRGRGRPKVISDAQRKELILECTRRLMLRQGYALTTTVQIAAKCRISKQTLYGVFPDKISIFIAIIEAHRQSMLALPGDYDGLPLDAALEKIFRIDIDAKANAERMAILKLTLAESQLSPELGKVLHEHGGEKAHAELARWLRRQSLLGKVAVGNADQDARILMDMVFGPIIRKSVVKLPMRGEYARDHIRRCIAIFLNGIAGRSPTRPALS